MSAPVARFAMPTPHPLVRVLLTLGGGTPASVELTDRSLSVSLGWTWRCVVPRSSVVAARPDPRRTVSIGAHGWQGSWLVNTSTRGLVVLEIAPAAHARCLGARVPLRELRVSLADPEAFLSALGAPRRT